MLTLLPTVKTRLAIPTEDTSNDVILTNAILAVSARFDHETHRTLARTENFTQEFDPSDSEILSSCYPVEYVSKFELKTSESTGWQEIQLTPDFLIRSSCIISLSQPLNPQLSTLNSLARLIYTGGYLLPDSPDTPGATRLPVDLEQAAVEQVAYWFQTRDHLGLKTTWPHEGTYAQFAQLPLILPVQAVLKRYERWSF